MGRLHLFNVQGPIESWVDGEKSADSTTQTGLSLRGRILSGNIPWFLQQTEKIPAVCNVQEGKPTNTEWWPDALAAVLPFSSRPSPLSNARMQQCLRFPHPLAPRRGRAFAVED